jgi:hypothetical protein
VDFISGRFGVGDLYRGRFDVTPLEESSSCHLFIYLLSIFKQRCPVQHSWFKWGSA